jgi:hypothetical protein
MSDAVIRINFCSTCGARGADSRPASELICEDCWTATVVLEIAASTPEGETREPQRIRAVHELAAMIYLRVCRMLRVFRVRPTRDDVLTAAREALVEACCDYRSATGERMTPEEIADIAGGVLAGANFDTARLGLAPIRISELLMGVR